MKIEVHCNDGSDPNCHQKVEIDFPFSGLSPSDVKSNWSLKNGREELRGIEISLPNPDWVKQNESLLKKLSVDVVHIKNDQLLEIEYRALELAGFFEHATCSSCGSSETYDGEGNNITAV
ncbi:MAG: hypothetical protein WCI39_01900 [Gallionellaceae bacterium]